MSPSHAPAGDPATILDALTGAWRVLPVTADSRTQACPAVLAVGATSLASLEAGAPFFCGPGELARLRALTVPRGREAFLQGRLAAKVAGRTMLRWLSPMADCDPRRLETAHDRLGRPCFLGVAAFGLSLSHCPGLAAAVVFPPDQPFGLDLERVRPRNALALADRFAPSELAMARAVAPPGCQAAWPLTLLWCLKEALGKLLGCGVTASPEALPVASLASRPGGIAAGYAHAAGCQGLAVASPSMILALAAPGGVGLELDLGALPLD